MAHACGDGGLGPQGHVGVAEPNGANVEPDVAADEIEILAGYAQQDSNAKSAQRSRAYPTPSTYSHPLNPYTHTHIRSPQLSMHAHEQSCIVDPVMLVHELHLPWLTHHAHRCVHLDHLDSS